MIPIPVGSLAPDFVLTDQQGRPLRMKDVLKDHLVLLIFYPSDWGYVCHQEMISFRDRQTEFEDAGYRLLGISFNDTASHGEWSDVLGLRFPLLSDTRGTVAASYGVLDDDVDSFNKGRSQRALFMVDDRMLITWSWIGKGIWVLPDLDIVLREARGRSVP